jgi:hypothetical protein
VDGLYGRNRHCVVVAEDLFEDWQSATSTLRSHLGLTIEEFAEEEIAQRHVNAGGEARFPVLARAMRLQPLVPRWVKSPARRMIGPSRIARATRWFDKVNRRAFRPPPLAERTRKWLAGYFAEVNGDLSVRVSSEQPWIHGEY